MFSASFILALYGYKNVYFNSHINNIKEFRNDFTKGNLYYFGILNHEFIVIYYDDDNIIYIDYYSETERGCRQINQVVPKAFRIERMTYLNILHYINDYLSGNIISNTKFHKGDQVYYRDYLNDVKRFGLEFEYTKLKINNIPTTWDVIKTVTESIEEHGIFCEQSDDYINAWKVYFYNLNKLLDSYKKSLS